MMATTSQTEDPGAAERLLEASWPQHGRRRERREERAEAVFTVLFLLVAGPLAVTAGPAIASPGLIAGLVLAYAVTSRVEFPVGAGLAVPTQLFLIPLLLLVSPALVPLLVLAGLALGLVGARLAGLRPPDRLLACGGNAWHAIGPALVLTLAGSPGPMEVSWWLLVAVLGAGIVSDVAASTIREWLRHGIPPALQLQVLALVAAVDTLLTPVGVLGALAALTVPAAPLMLLGLVGLLAVLAHDRNLRIARAQARLEALHRERRRLQIAVRRIGDAFASKLDLDALLTITVRASVEALDADAGRASVHYGGRRRLVRRASVHEQPALDPALQAVELRVASLGRPSEAAVDDVWAIACPVGRHDAEASVGIGVLALARRGHPFSEEERALFGYLCEQAGVAADDVARHDALHRQALTDELTGLANHRRLQELLDAAAKRHGDTRTPVGLVLLDIDNFKGVNDVHGHQTGDRVLRAVGDCLREVCRSGEEPARYGGEEMAVVVADADLELTGVVAERMRQAIESLALVTSSGELLTITASFGVAALGGRTTDKTGLIEAADRALYRAKHEGKNCVRTADELSPDELAARSPHGSARRAVSPSPPQVTFTGAAQSATEVPNRDRP